VVSDVLGPLDLPAAPAVTRVAAAPVVRPRLPAIALLCLGVLLILGPIAGGLFSKVAAGKQMIDQFAPYMDTNTLARYDADIATLRNGAAGVNATYAKQHVATGKFPGLDDYRNQSAAIDARAASLLRQVTASQPDYQKVASIGGFDRIPYLIVISGIVAVYGGCVLRFGARRRTRSTALLVVAASAAVALYPFISNFENGASAGRRMVKALSPVMTTGQVRHLQDNFIVLVTAVGELDTTFNTVPQTGAAATEVHALVKQWPAISSDLASLVGTINDNIGNFNALKRLDSLTSGVGVSGLEAFPWMLVGIGAISATLSVAGLPRRKKETR
jgi:hypothetical protein